MRDNEIIQKLKKSNHFLERIKQREILLEEVEECIIKGAKTYLFNDRIKYSLNNLQVVLSEKDLVYITAIRIKQKTKREKKKVFGLKRYNNGNHKRKQSINHKLRRLELGN